MLTVNSSSRRTYSQPSHSALAYSNHKCPSTCSCHMEVMAAFPPLMQLSSSKCTPNLLLCNCALSLNVVGQGFMHLQKCTNSCLVLLICPLVNLLPTANYVFGELFKISPLLKDYGNSKVVYSLVLIMDVDFSHFSNGVQQIEVLC